MMAVGRIILEDNVQIGPNTMIVTTNHDFNHREVVLHKPAIIKKNTWIGGRSLILPGVTVGENAVVLGGSRNTWRLQLDLDLIQKDGRWLITEIRASTY